MVSIFVESFRHVAEEMGLPRVIVTRHPMGRPLGPPGDRDRHAAVVEAALSVLETAGAGGTLIDLPEPYRPLSASVSR